MRDLRHRVSIYPYDGAVFSDLAAIAAPFRTGRLLTLATVGLLGGKVHVRQNESQTGARLCVRVTISAAYPELHDELFGIPARRRAARLRELAVSSFEGARPEAAPCPTPKPVEERPGDVILPVGLT